MRKRAQGWGFDIIIASTLFLFAIILFYQYSLNYSSENEEIIQSLSYDGNIIGNSLLSEGYPKNWNATNVITPGILSDNKINNTKLELFYNLSLDYNKSKSLFNTRFDYYINFSMLIYFNDKNVSGIGKRFSDWCDRADVNKDGLVNETDQKLVIEHIDPHIQCFAPNWCDNYDVNQDRRVSGDDVSAVTTQWNQGASNCKPLKNLIKVVRFTIYNNNPVSLNIYTWE